MKKKISAIKIFFMLYRLPEDVRGSVYAAITSGIQWEKNHHDKKGDKGSKKNIIQCG